MMERARTSIIPVLVLILWTLGLPRVDAHGILAGSSPRPNAVLPASPKEVVLAFSEPVDPTYSTASVRDQRGTNYASAVRVGPDGRRMLGTLRSLPPGLYTVRWRVLSAVDGHTTAGTFFFSVGQALAAAPPATAGPDLRVVIARWITLAAALLLAGTVMFEMFVFRWGLARSAGPSALHEGGRLQLRRMTIIAALVYLVAADTEFVFQAAVLLDRGVRDVSRLAVLGPLMVGTRSGWGLLLRASMALITLIPASAGGRIARFAALIWLVVVASVIAVLGGPAALASAHVTAIVLVGTVYALAAVLAAVILPRIPDLRIPEGRWVPVAAVAVLLSGFTLTSHAVASGPVAFAADWLHLMAAALWVGGLPALLLFLRRLPPAERSLAARVLVPRVSGLAGVALLTMAVTGLYSAWLHIPALRALVTTPYGKELLLKLLLVAIVIGLGALNRFAFRPRIESGSDQGGGALRAFRRSASTEVALGVAILLVVAVLTITPPASVVTSVRPQPGLQLAGLTARYRVGLTINREEGGWAEFEAAVTDASGGKAVEGARVTLRVTSLERAVDSSVEMTPIGADRFTAAGDYLRQAGFWSAALSVRRQDGIAEEVMFPLRVGEQTRAPDPLAAESFMRVRDRLGHARTWREDVQITDGLGHVAATRFAAARPDRLRFETRGGSEAVIIGAVRYSREQGGVWARDALPQAIRLNGPYADYMNGAAEVRFGREVQCGSESCQIVLWRLPAARAAFAAWVGRRTGTVYRLMMVAPEHHMTSRVYDLNARVVINAP